MQKMHVVKKSGKRKERLGHESPVRVLSYLPEGRQPNSNFGRRAGRRRVSSGSCEAVPGGTKSESSNMCLWYGTCAALQHFAIVPVHPKPHSYCPGTDGDCPIKLEIIRARPNNRDMAKRSVSPDEMQNFARQFSKTEWRQLCNDKRFLTFVTEDLGKAQLLADAILNKTNK
jgi:hypothetical protein